jgi:hypothetical protein
MKLSTIYLAIPFFVMNRLMILVALTLGVTILSGQDFQKNPLLFKLTRSDKRALLNFRITNEHLAKLEAVFSKSKTRFEKDPAFRLESKSNQEILPKASLLETNKARAARSPIFEQFLKDVQLSDEEYALAISTLMMCYWVVPPDAHSAGDIKVSYLPRQNIEFFIGSRKRATELLESAPRSED